eukprot:12712955-Alexandrium_andersonii.AAC.1
MRGGPSPCLLAESHSRSSAAWWAPGNRKDNAGHARRRHAQERENKASYAPASNCTARLP